MSDSRQRVQEVAKALGIVIAEERIDQLAEGWEQALADAEAVRQKPNPWPTPRAFDASWSEKR